MHRQGTFIDPNAGAPSEFGKIEAPTKSWDADA
jgi:hypothetical protein